MNDYSVIIISSVALIAIARASVNCIWAMDYKCGHFSTQVS